MSAWGLAAMCRASSCIHKMLGSLFTYPPPSPKWDDGWIAGGGWLMRHSFSAYGTANRNIGPQSPASPLGADVTSRWEAVQLQDKKMGCIEG